MNKHRRRKCLHCGDSYRPDPRNLRHQRYCSKSQCRKASKAASERRWLAKAPNRDYFRGAASVERVRAWRAAHPGYWRRPGAQSTSALQADSLAQPIETHEKSPPLAALALQDLLGAQPVVLIALIANSTCRVRFQLSPHKPLN
jgi:hypothetical protein